MLELTPETLQELLKLGAIAGTARDVANGNTQYALVPEGFQIESLSEFIYNEHAKAPERIKQKVGVLDPESFIEYYQLFGDENSRTFAYEPDLSVTSVLDYHGAKEGAPRWGDHQVRLTLRKSVEWERWNGANNKQVGQQAFAEFLEQNAIDITSPTPANMMEVANDLQATTDVQFGSGIRMADGQVRFKYSEEIKATVGGGQLQVPERFTLALPVFTGGPRVPMDALLRFRVKEGKLLLWYTLIRPEEVLRTAFLAARDQIAGTLKVVVINGTPAL